MIYRQFSSRNVPFFNKNLGSKSSIGSSQENLRRSSADEKKIIIICICPKKKSILVDPYMRHKQCICLNDLLSAIVYIFTIYSCSFGFMLLALYGLHFLEHTLKDHLHV